jgi:uncharacterized damage-inducible protein DinB
MNRQDILTLYDYNAWANGRTLGAVEALAPEQFLKDLGNSFASVRDTLVHIAGAEWVWLRRWQGESPTALIPGTDFPTFASVKERFASIQGERQTFLASLAEERLARPFDYKDLAGNAYRLPLVQSMQHVVNHGTYHRGQITTMLRQLGARPVSTDLSRYYLEKAAGK